MQWNHRSISKCRQQQVGKSSVGDCGTHCNVPIQIQGLSLWKRTEFPAAAYLRTHRQSHVHAHAPTCRYSLCSFFTSYRCEPIFFLCRPLAFEIEPPNVSLYRRRAMRAARSYCVTGARARGGLQGLYRAANLFFCACDVFTFVILTGPV
ncbi:unnamed protein product [Danaus chrysippus]|uniref:(African queen) hypothetical protein n=1 Tax=Danaus chrysippus TaxID=151541 RepID=A0A8J2R6E3_9NEOP|nr:unnamed protein product [Danaus chrysippus]